MYCYIYLKFLKFNYNLTIPKDVIPVTMLYRGRTIIYKLFGTCHIVCLLVKLIVYIFELKTLLISTIHDSFLIFNLKFFHSQSRNTMLHILAD